MNRKLIANIIGWAGIACSLAFWAWLGVFAKLSFHQRGDWMNLELGVSNVWPVLWLAGLLLLLIAALIGSKKWVFAAFVPVVSCAAAMLFFSKFQP